jgi:hypothetical protein
MILSGANRDGVFGTHTRALFVLSSLAALPHHTFTLNALSQDGAMDLLKHLGFATPLVYAAAAYGLFHWLDKNASKEAKIALAGLLKYRNYDGKQVATAFVNVFDTLYTRPLLHWNAMLRSALYIWLVTVIYMYEVYWWLLPRLLTIDANLVIGVNAICDYVSLFVIRRWLIRSETRPILSLVGGLIAGCLVVFCVFVFRMFTN